jgi:hypothetical protein
MNIIKGHKLYNTSFPGQQSWPELDAMLLRR